MKVYLVGGAVRDQLLGRKVKEKDWVVVGATPEKMLELGYKPVGKDFPVFLNPKTGEEYALARTERKTAKGYHGFEFNVGPSVTLEEDLSRRDLTVNAMAQTKDGEIVDPFNGQKDLHAKLLRHVSDAFAEDPVRILRIARFASRFSDFNIHPYTLKLMKNMVSSGEVDALVAERVWKECSRALDEPAPWRFFETLSDCGALAIVFPEIDPTNIDTLKKVTEISDDGPTRFSALTYPLSSETVKKLCQRIRVPSDYKEIAILVANHKKALKNLDLNNAKQVVEFLEALDCYRRPNRLIKFVLAVAANENTIDANAIMGKLDGALQLTISVDAKPFVEQGLKNEAIGEAVRKARVEILMRHLVFSGSSRSQG